MITHSLMRWILGIAKSGTKMPGKMGGIVFGDA